MATRYVGIKGKAWSAVKAWARRKFTDCYTCYAQSLEGKNAQAGHYQPVGLVGLNNVLSWDPRLIRLQCGYCNGVGQGQQAIFRRRLVTEYGEEAIAEVDHAIKAKTVNKVKDWQEVIDRFNSL